MLWHLDFNKITPSHIHGGGICSPYLSHDCQQKVSYANASCLIIIHMNNVFLFFLFLATMFLLCCFSWEEPFGWLSTAYVPLSANTSLQSFASSCHSSRCAHQLNPFGCWWAGRQVNGQHLSLQLSGFPSVPALHISHSLPPRLSNLPLREIKTLQYIYILPSDTFLVP